MIFIHNVYNKTVFEHTRYKKNGQIFKMIKNNKLTIYGVFYYDKHHILYF